MMNRNMKYMTQQRYSKKGFTLVELVVVIAILGILAAIAIPSVIGMINSAAESATASDAAELNKACREYYSSVMSGAINSEAAGNSGQANLPPIKSTITQRKAAAKAATVVNVCNYYGLEKIISHFDTGERAYGYDSTGDIKPMNDSLTAVVRETTLKDLYG